jgi:hypothetical protein
VTSTTSLFAYADIVDYSSRNAAQQGELQERLVRVLDESMEDAGVMPAAVSKQDQGDARLLAFPPGTDTMRVLAIMPRSLSAELQARNADAAPHAQLRVRLSFALGPTAAGPTGHLGKSAIEVVRLCNARPFREAMRAMPGACLGVIVSDFLYTMYIRQGFRAGLDAGEYVRVRVSDQDKGFHADAWLRLIGHPPEGRGASPAELPSDGVRPSGPALPGRGAGRQRPLTDGATRMIAAVIVGILGLAGVGLTLLFSASSQPPRSGPSGLPTLTARSGTPQPTPTDGTPLPAVTEYGDWGPGVAVYASTAAASSNAPLIRLNQGVRVSCVAPNVSGIPSINAFYLISSGPWRGTYASANEFTNGGPLDTQSDPDIDPRIRPCPAG